jgi:UDP-glucose 4-epimerase
MNYLVTGGAGFLGRAVSQVLLQLGHTITVFDNFSRGDKNFVKEISHCKLVEGDIRDKEALSKAFIGIDSIIHLAFVNGTKFFYSMPDRVVDVGIKGMINVSDLAQENNVTEIVLFSSSEVYQSPKTIPTPEEVELVIPDILNPRYSYGGAKIVSELLLTNYCDKFLDKWKIIRPHNIYGPNMGFEHVIPELIEKALVSEKSLEIKGDGLQTRSFCHITDFKQAFTYVLQDPRKKEIYNIGTNEESSIINLANLICNSLGKELEIKTSETPLGETNRRIPDISKITDLGFKQEIKLKRGIEELINNRIKS